MSKNGLHRHYDRLTGEERFRLDVLAMARGNLKESERLVSSCPRETYTMTARDFGGRWGAVENIALRMYVAINNELSKLQMVDAFREMVPYQETLSSNMTFDAYYKGHKSGSYHARNYAGKAGWGALLEKGSGLPFLSREVSGIDLGARAGEEGGA